MVMARFLLNNRIGIVSQLDNYSLEYAYWDPATNTWDITIGDFNTLAPHSGNQWNTGIFYQGKIYLPPSSEVEEVSQEPMLLLRTLDPATKAWTLLPIKKVTVPNALFSLHFQNMFFLDDKLYILQYGNDGDWPGQAFHVYRYDPADDSYTSFARLALPPNTVSAQLLHDGSDFYVVSCSEFYHPYYQMSNEIHIFRANVDLSVLTPLISVPANTSNGQAFIMDNRIYLYGNPDINSFIYFGAEYDLTTGQWQMMNPTYGANYYLPTLTYWTTMHVIDGHVYNDLPDGSQIVEWDVNYRRSGS